MRITIKTILEPKSLQDLYRISCFHDGNISLKMTDKCKLLEEVARVTEDRCGCRDRRLGMTQERHCFGPMDYGFGGNSARHGMSLGLAHSIRVFFFFIFR